MLNISSPLETSHAKGGYGLQAAQTGVILQVHPLDGLTQIAGWADTIENVAALLKKKLELPESIKAGRVSSANGLSVFQSAPSKFMVIGQSALLDELTAKIPSDQAMALDISHSRIKVSVSGEMATEFLSRGMAIDLDESRFQVSSVASTALETVSILIHHATQGQYDLYIPRAFARSLWEWMYETGLQFGLEIK